MNTKKIVMIWMIAQALVISQAAHALTAAEEDLNLGLRNYRMSHYRKALYYFGKVERKHLEDERAQLYDYIMKVMENYKDRLYAIEKDEASFRKATGDESAKKAIAAEHFLVAGDIVKEKFYLPMVEPHLKRAAALMPSDSAVRTRLGDVYYSGMRYYEAVESYEKAVKLDKENLYALKMAADASVALGDFDKAKELYKEFLKSVKKYGVKYPASESEKVERVLAVLPETYKDVNKLLKEERADEAEIILKKRLSLNPGDYVAITALGNIYQDRGDRNKALDFFKKAIKMAPDYPLGHLYLGRLYFIMRQNDKAVSELRVFKEKMAILPKMDAETKKMYIGGLAYLSEVYFTLERSGECKQELDNMLRLDPKDQGTYYSMGVYYYKYEHSRSKAYQAFKKALDLDPKSDVGKAAFYAIEFMRNNPDSRVTPDFSFINQEYRE